MCVLSGVSDTGLHLPQRDDAGEDEHDGESVHGLLPLRLWSSHPRPTHAARREEVGHLRPHAPAERGPRQTGTLFCSPNEISFVDVSIVVGSPGCSPNLVV